MDTLKKRLFYYQPVQRTNYRQAAPSEAFWTGMASGVDLLGQSKTQHFFYSPWKADFEALGDDWKVVCHALKKSTRVYYFQHRKQLPDQERLFDPDDTAKAS